MHPPTMSRIPVVLSLFPMFLTVGAYPSLFAITDKFSFLGTRVVTRPLPAYSPFTNIVASGSEATIWIRWVPDTNAEHEIDQTLNDKATTNRTPLPVFIV